ncbi:MAG: DUF1552 domain-containing protein [Acidobacteria bacterium]|nr:DUF1552 domain-containing protein [Acidobacteriota bacterium]
MNTPHTRRRFLKNAGVVIALPVMESVLPRATAQAAAKKPVKRFVCLSNNYGVYPQAFFPAQGGRDYEMSPTLRPLEPHRADFSVFSNLDHGLQGGHACVPSLLSGVMPVVAPNFPEMNMSLDQKLAEHVGSATRYPSMALKVNDANLISFTRTGVQVPAMDLQAMYRALFIDEDAKNKEAVRERFARHGSILDVVMDEAKTVEKSLGREDKAKFGEYLEAVRGLERKIAQDEPWIDRAKPKTTVTEPPQGKGTEKDLKAMIELIALAMQTDSSRVFTLTGGFVNGDFGKSGGYHGFSHHGERDAEVAALKAIEGYQVAMMAHLIDLLKAQPDPLNGGTLFDHTTILYGCGMATGQHTTRNLPILLAGGGFKLGEHRVLPDGKTERLPAANLLLSVLQSFGVETDRFGTSTGTLRGLEWKA